MRATTKKKTDAAAEQNDEFSWLNRHAWLSGVDLEVELLQAEQEGRDLSSVRTQIRALQKAPRPAGGWAAQLGGARDAAWLARYSRLCETIQALPLRANYAYEEPDDLAGIRRARAPARVGVPAWHGSAARLRAPVHGGLSGRILRLPAGQAGRRWYRTQHRDHGEGTGTGRSPPTSGCRPSGMAERIEALRPVQKFARDRRQLLQKPLLLPRIQRHGPRRRHELHRPGRGGC